MGIIDFSKAKITVDTSDAAAAELEKRIAWSKMTLEEKKALAYAESEAWEREVGLKPPADEKQ